MLEITGASSEKLKGAYYTPAPIARFMLKWGLEGKQQQSILEPSCGDGVFLRELSARIASVAKVTAVEYDPEEADKAARAGMPKMQVLCDDFHSFCLSCTEHFDFVVGNPPFIRYQYYPREQQERASHIFKQAGLTRSKLTNAWVSFVVGGTLLLKETGRLAFVLPSELLMVKYASQLRRFLAKTFNKITIISFQNLVFEQIQQDVILLLCEKNKTEEHLIEHLEIADIEDLEKLEPTCILPPRKRIDFEEDKWTYYFLEQEEIDFLEKIKKSAIPKMSRFCDVEVGITTGANKYFTVSQDQVKAYKLERYARPMVGRSVQLEGLNFTTQDWHQNNASGARANLLVFDESVPFEQNPGVMRYLCEGEQMGIHQGFKTSIRNDWYIIPSVRCSDALYLRRNNVCTKLVLNEAKAYTTDTMHRVYIHENVNKKAFIASYYNSLSFVFAEILGRNFGGGCLELMPSEVEDILLPYREENAEFFDELNYMVRNKRPMEEILNYADNLILRKNAGFTEKEIKLCRSIWHKLVAHRKNRQFRAGPKALKKMRNICEDPHLPYFQQFFASRAN